jgi:hypothetical protein
MFIYREILFTQGMQSLHLVITFDTNNIGTHVCNILQV